MATSPVHPKLQDANTELFSDDATIAQLKQQANADSETIFELGQTISALKDQVDSLQPPVIFNDLECLVWNVAGGTVANTGTTGNTATFQQTLPGLQSATRRLIPNGAYADKYSFLMHGANPALKTFRQEGSFLFPTSTDASASQAIEFDLQQCIGGVVFNMGWQFDYAEGLLRYWNRDANVKQPGTGWKPTGVTITRPAPGTWTSCVFDMHRDGATIYYDKATINGVVMGITPASFPAPNLGLSDMLNFGFQLDGEKVPNAYTVAIDRFRLQAWK